MLPQAGTGEFLVAELPSESLAAAPLLCGRDFVGVSLLNGAENRSYCDLH